MAEWSRRINRKNGSLFIGFNTFVTVKPPLYMWVCEIITCTFVWKHESKCKKEFCVRLVRLVYKEHLKSGGAVKTSRGTPICEISHLQIVNKNQKNIAQCKNAKTLSISSSNNMIKRLRKSGEISVVWQKKKKKKKYFLLNFENMVAASSRFKSRGTIWLVN